MLYAPLYSVGWPAVAENPRYATYFSNDYSKNVFCIGAFTLKLR